MSDDLPDSEDAFMRSAFDPSFKFEPIVPPAEHELARIEAASLLLENPCQHCNADTKLISGTDTLPRVLGFTHEEGCPSFSD